MEIEEFYNEFISRFNGYKRFFSSDDCKNISKEKWTRGMENYLKKHLKKTMNLYVFVKIKL